MLFCGVLPHLLLLYKQLPSKGKIIMIYLNIYFIGLPLYSEEKLYSSTLSAGTHMPSLTSVVQISVGR